MTTRHVALIVCILVGDVTRGAEDSAVVWRKVPSSGQGWRQDFVDRVAKYSPEQTIDSLCHRNQDFSAVLMAGMRGAMPGPDSRFHYTLADHRVQKLRSSISTKPEAERAAAASAIFDRMIETYRTLPSRPTQEKGAKFAPTDYDQLHYSVCAALVLVSDFDTVQSTLEKIDYSGKVIREKRISAMAEPASPPVSPRELEEQLDRLFLANLYLYMLDQQGCRSDEQVAQILTPAYRLATEAMPRWNLESNAPELAEIVGRTQAKSPKSHVRGLHRVPIAWQQEPGQKQIESAVQKLRALVVECAGQRPANKSIKVITRPGSGG
jgi:hypothetical protein